VVHCFIDDVQIIERARILLNNLILQYQLEQWLDIIFFSDLFDQLDHIAHQKLTILLNYLLKIIFQIVLIINEIQLIQKLLKILDIHFINFIPDKLYFPVD